MIFTGRHRGDNRLWVVLFFAGVILTVATMRFSSQPASPVPVLIFQHDALHLTTENNTSAFGNCRLSGAAGAAATPFFFAPVPVNSADKSLLMTLPGIGEGLSMKIITFRNQHGPIENLEDFAKIGGIGAKRIETLHNSITFE